MKILIAEDDLTSRTILVSMLSKRGFEVKAAANGDEAYKALENDPSILLALIDWEMPGMSGLDVCRKIRKLDAQIPPYLILLTAKSEKENIVKGLDAGANDYIPKPYHKEELHARIRVGQRMIELQEELIEARDALAHEAMHDPLTGSLNRRAILDALNKELNRSQRTNSSVSIGLCDLDHFKKVNDTYGHQAGDDVLRGFVDTVRNNLRGYDLVGRYGGEEFLVVAPGSTGAKKEKLYERLRAQVEAFRLPMNSGKLGITVSIGVASSVSTSTVDEMIGAADRALYKAKEDGRNQVCIAETSQD